MFESFGDLVAFGMLGLQPGTAAGEAVQFFVMDVTKIFALLVIVIYVMGLLRALLSPERVREFVRGRPNWQARGFAVGRGKTDQGAQSTSSLQEATIGSWSQHTRSKISDRRENGSDRLSPPERSQLPYPPG